MPNPPDIHHKAGFKPALHKKTPALHRKAGLKPGLNKKTPDIFVLLHPTPDQIRQIAALYYAQGWFTDDEMLMPDLIPKIVAGSHCFMIAATESEIVGMGRSISDRVSDAYIQDVTVNAAYRGMGIGSEIIRALIRGLHADGIRWIGLIAEQGSSEFYRYLGFEEMGGALPMLKK